MNNICDYDEAYDRNAAEEFGWCTNCKIKNCPKNKTKSYRYLSFETPEGKHCNGHKGNCLALETHKTGWCKYFKEYLRWDDYTYSKCEECLKLN